MRSMKSLKKSAFILATLSLPIIGSARLVQAQGPIDSDEAKVLGALGAASLATFGTTFEPYQRTGCSRFNGSQAADAAVNSEDKMGRIVNFEGKIGLFDKYKEAGFGGPSRVRIPDNQLAQIITQSTASQTEINSALTKIAQAAPGNGHVRVAVTFISPLDVKGIDYAKGINSMTKVFEGSVSDVTARIKTASYSGKISAMSRFAIGDEYKAIQAARMTSPEYLAEQEKMNAARAERDLHFKNANRFQKLAKRTSPLAGLALAATGIYAVHAVSNAPSKQLPNEVGPSLGDELAAAKCSAAKGK